MRTGMGVLCIVATLGVALPAGAQQITSSATWGKAFTGNDPRQIKFTKIDVSKAAQAFPMSNMIKTPTPQRAFSFTNLLPKFSMPSWPPKIGVPQLPQGKNPYQPNRPVGVNLFSPKK